MLSWSYVEGPALSQGGESRGSERAHCVLSSGMTGSCRAREQEGSALALAVQRAANASEQGRVKIKFPISWLWPSLYNMFV